MELYILDDSLNTVGILDRAVEMTLTRHYFAPAELELILPLEVNLPAGGKYIYIPDRDECIVIESERGSSDGILHIFGRGAECILERRVIKGDRVYYGNIELAVRRCVSQALSGDSTMEHLRISEELCGLTETGHLSAFWDVLSNWLYEKLRPYGASFKVTLDTAERIFCFKIVKGVDRTPSQSDRGVVILSDTLGTIGDGEIAKNTQGLFNTAYVVGEDGTVVTAVTGEAAGEDRRELYVSARDVFRSSFDTDADYAAALRHRGLERLMRERSLLTLKGEGTGSESVEYAFGKNYGLGDLCRLSFGGMQADVRATAVRERWHGGNVETLSYFG